MKHPVWPVAICGVTRGAALWRAPWPLGAAGGDLWCDQGTRSSRSARAKGAAGGDLWCDQGVQSRVNLPEKGAAGGDLWCDQGVTVAELGQRIFERILEVASGDQTKSEALGFGDDEFIPWQIGAVM